MKRFIQFAIITLQIFFCGIAFAGWSNISTATLVSRAWDDNDSFTFATGTVAPGGEGGDGVDDGDFLIETNIIWLGVGIAFRDLGAGTLENVTSVPTTGYSTSSPIDVMTGKIYSFKLLDGTYGVVEFTAVAEDAPGSAGTQCVFKYKIYTPECDCTDTDGDGVIDQWDNCPDTPRGTPTDANGCPAKRGVVVVPLQ